MGEVDMSSALAAWIKKLFCKHWWYFHSQYVLDKILFITVNKYVVQTEYRCCKCGKIKKELDVDDYRPKF